MARRLMIPLGLLALTLVALLLPRPSAAQTRTRCFPETGRCVSGPILDYWERNGGLAVFGFPITDLRTESVEGTWTGPVQWFERDRLEDHGAEGVMAGRLGARILEARGVNWQTDYGPDMGAPNGCSYFAVTRRYVCEPFLSYWYAGGGLERFGYPLSPPLTETIDGWTGTVQYFERRRMEHHLELAGTRYEVLLGLLGRDVLQQAPPPVCATQVVPELRTAYETLGFRQALGCPTAVLRDVQAAVQRYERGAMVWLNLGLEELTIYAYWPSVEPGSPLRFVREPDTWQPGDPEGRGLTPPAGRYEPVRGFGNVWWKYRRGPTTIGWAVEPERGERALVQRFDNGSLLVWLSGESYVYAFGPQPKDLAVFLKP